MQQLFSKTSEHLDKTQRNKLRNTLINYQDVLHKLIMIWDLQTQKMRLPHHMADEADKQVRDMLKKRIIEKLNSPWSGLLELC